MLYITNNTKCRIKLGRQHFEIINLSAPLNLNTEVFPGDPPLERTVFCTIKEQGCLYHIHHLGDHLFHPHGDAPNHQNPEAYEHGFEYWGLDYVFNEALLIDLAKAPEAKEINNIRFLKTLTAEHLVPHLENIRTKTAIILRTGYDQWLARNYKHDPELIPHLTEEAGKLLNSMPQLKVIATDSITVDKPGSNTCHRMLKEKFIVEGMVNLNHIPESAHANFFLQTSPVAIEGASGGPVTAYAWIETNEKSDNE